MQNKEHLEAEYERIRDSAFGAKWKAKKLGNTEELEKAIRDIGEFLVSIRDPYIANDFVKRTDTLIRHGLLRKDIKIGQVISNGSKEKRKEIAGKDFSYFRSQLYALERILDRAVAEKPFGDILEGEVHILERELFVWSTDKPGLPKPLCGKVKMINSTISQKVLPVARFGYNYGLPDDPKWTLDLEDYAGEPFSSSQNGQKIEQKWVISLRGREEEKQIKVYEYPEGSLGVNCNVIDELFRGTGYRTKAVISVVELLRNKAREKTGCEKEFRLGMEAELDSAAAEQLRLQCEPVKVEGKTIYYYRGQLGSASPLSYRTSQPQIYIPNKGEVARYFKNR